MYDERFERQKQLRNNPTTIHINANFNKCLTFSWEEDRARYLENLSKKLIRTEFKKLVKDDNVLNLHVFIEDVYETRIGPNDANLTMLEMMRGIELKYRQELLQLDKVF